jgi:hypothetical protein
LYFLKRKIERERRNFKSLQISRKKKQIQENHDLPTGKGERSSNLPVTKRKNSRKK